MTVLVAIETVVLVLLVVLVTGLLRSHATILRQLEELGAGVGDPSTADGERRGVTSPVDFKVRPGIPEPRDDPTFADAADLTGAGLRDDIVAVRVVGAEHPTLLAFLSSTCLTCAHFWEAFAGPTELTLPGGTRLVIVTKGPDDESPSAIAELAPPGVTLVMSSEAWESYRVPGSPYFVFVDGPTGRIRGEGTGMSWEQVANLLAQATGDLSFRLGDAGQRMAAKPESDAARELRIDQELMAAGIYPGDQSLYETPPPTSGAPSPAAGAPAGGPEPGR